jgi:protein-tyrosine phosphatase
MNPICILFVCSGNICRSPMAEAMLRSMMPQDWHSEVKIYSAGTLGIEGAPADERAKRVMEEININLRSHRSQGVTPESVKNCDYILVMSSDHLDYFREHFPEHMDKVHLLRSFKRDDPLADELVSIADPVDAPLERFRDTRDMIQKEIMRILPQLATLVEVDLSKRGGTNRSGWWSRLFRK